MSSIVGTVRSLGLAALVAAAAAGCRMPGAPPPGLSETQPQPYPVEPDAFALAGVTPADRTVSLPALTDGNIVSALLAADSLEVLTGKEGQAKATGPDVKVYAGMLVADHQRARDQLAALAHRLGITPEAPAGDTAAAHHQHVMARMEAAPQGVAFDTLYVHHGVRDHVHDLADAHAYLDRARNAELRAFIQSSVVPILEKDLESAEGLTTSFASRPAGQPGAGSS